MISQMEFTAPWFREALVDKECHRMLELYSDMEQVEVYVSKSKFFPIVLCYAVAIIP